MQTHGCRSWKFLQTIHQVKSTRLKQVPENDEINWNENFLLPLIKVQEISLSNFYQNETMAFGNI